MEIRLEKLIPLPMVELTHSETSIWEAENFTFKQGKSYLVEAASGKGKTSLLTIMYGLRDDYKGMLQINEKDARSIRQKEWTQLRKQHISFIFQGLELFDDLTAMENILLKNKIANFKTKDEILNLAEKLDVAGSMCKKSKFLSFGQQQRIAIIRALCQPFVFLFADECFSHIDRSNSNNAFELLKEECSSQGAGLILTSLGNSTYKFDEYVEL
ncbi:ATP-binding cassette domain-containing protein [Bacteroidota bacterium]